MRRKIRLLERERAGGNQNPWNHKLWIVEPGQISRVALRNIVVHALLIYLPDQERKPPRLGLATGNTLKDLYQQIADQKIPEAQSVRDAFLSAELLVGLDEYCPPSGYTAEDWARHEHSHAHFYRTRVEEPLGLPPGTVKIPNVANVGDFERQVLGNSYTHLNILEIGKEGQVGFNQRGASRDARTRLVDLHGSTPQANAGECGGDVANVHKQACTRGIPEIMNTGAILVLASGRDRAEAVRDSWKGKISPDCPASYLQEHPDVVYIVDEDAASLLEGR